MKRKVLVVIAAAAIIITTIKTGYAYYESQLKALSLQNTTDQDLGESINYGDTKSSEIIKDSVVDDSIETYALTWNEDGDVYDYKESEGEEFLGGCCGSGAYSMLDEKGNLKTPEVYEDELNEGVKNGELSLEEKDYLMKLLNECNGFYLNDAY